MLHVLHPLIYDRELHLPDGSLVVSARRYDGAVKSGSVTPLRDGQFAGVASRRPDGSLLYRIHPAFRIMGLTDQSGAVTLGSSTAASGPKQSFPDSETLSLFTYHTVPDLTTEHHKQLLLTRYSDIDKDAMSKLLTLNDLIRHQGQAGGTPSATPLLSPFSTRQLLRIGLRVHRQPECLGDVLHRYSMAAFMPQAVREVWTKLLSEAGIEPVNDLSSGVGDHLEGGSGAVLYDFLFCCRFNSRCCAQSLLGILRLLTRLPSAHSWFHTRCFIAFPPMFGV